MKKIILGLLITLLVLPVSVNAKSNEKVKVYIFEAGGCPACEAQMTYLKGLDGYNKTFEIIEEEEYVDHIEWKPGKDYDLGVTVANAFNAAGYTDATYQATPFVVVGGVYAAAAYNANLETVINQVAEDGDADVVGCFAEGKKNCADKITKIGTASASDTKTSSSSNKDNTTAITVILAIVMIITYLVKSTIDTNRIIDSMKKKNK